jgi:hypothetical protein
MLSASIERFRSIGVTVTLIKIINALSDCGGHFQKTSFSSVTSSV